MRQAERDSGKREGLSSADRDRLKQLERENLELTEGGVEPSVGSVGDFYDNALAETIIGLLKTEVVHHRGPWRSVDAVEYATLEWVDWFNNRRLLESISIVPPAELEMQYLRQPSESTIPAGLNATCLRRTRGDSLSRD